MRKISEQRDVDPKRCVARAVVMSLKSRRISSETALCRLAVSESPNIVARARIAKAILKQSSWSQGRRMLNRMVQDFLEELEVDYKPDDWAGKAYTLVMRQLRDSDAAQDVLQNTFIYLFVEVRKATAKLILRGQSPTALVIQKAKSAAYDFLRSERARRQRGEDYTSGETSISAEDAHRWVMEDLPHADKSAVEPLYRAIKKADKTRNKQLTRFLVRLIHGDRPSEIGHDLEIPRQSVSVYMTKIRQTTQYLLEQGALSV